MAESTKATTAAMPSLAELQHWTWVLGRAQQMLLEQGLATLGAAETPLPPIPGLTDPETLTRARDFWSDDGQAAQHPPDGFDGDLRIS